MKECCKTCRLWDSENVHQLQNATGEVVNESAYCRYHAPTTSREPWPRTFATDLCGRWKPKDEPE